MTTERSAAVSAAKVPPRPLIRSFWLLHRAVYRLTGGRFGLQTPRSGQRFGTMRLTTVGRRSGKERVAIIGYFEDGPNLVSLAMNGWGASEPAWWLNLQASPETIVELPGGPRAFRARAASGAERERLWRRFADFPGWGEVEGLAARRPMETAVVVFEPHGKVGVAPGGAGSGRPAGSNVSVVEPGHPPAGGRFALGLRHLWIAPGLSIAVVGNLVAQEIGIGILALVAFGVAPDLPRLLGIGQPRRPGHMAGRAIRIHNLAHHPLPPLVLTALAVAAVLPGIAQVAGLVWLGHVVVGLGIGDRQRLPDGSLGPLVPWHASRRRSPSGPAAEALP